LFKGFFSRTVHTCVFFFSELVFVLLFVLVVILLSILVLVLPLDDQHTCCMCTLYSVQCILYLRKWYLGSVSLNYTLLRPVTMWALLRCALYAVPSTLCSIHLLWSCKTGMSYVCVVVKSPMCAL
jgi:hypothetical protein